MADLDDILHSVLEASPVPMAINDDGQAITHLNSAFSRAFGYLPSDLPTLQAWWREAYPDSAYREWVCGQWRQRLEAARSNGTRFEAMEVQVRAKDGSVHTVVAAASPIGSSLAGAHLVSLQDVTERKQAEDRLRLSEERHRLIAEFAKDTIWTMAPDGSFTYFSPAVEQVRGLTPDEAMRQTMAQALAPASLAVATAYLETLNAAVRSGRRPEDFRGELEYLRKDGSSFWAEVIAHPILSPDGSLVELLGLSRDIDERKRAEDRLRASEARYRLLAENVSDVIWVLDLQTRRFTYISPSVAQLRGYTPEQIMAQPVDAALTPDSAHAVAQSIQAAQARFAAGDFSTRTHAMEVDQPHRDGHVVHTEVVTRYLLDGDGRATTILGVTRDISERRRAQLQLEKYRLHLEEMVAARTRELSIAKDAAEAANRSKSAFLANMSHELRTPLNAITGFAHLVKRSLSDPSQLDRLDKIIGAGQHLVEIVNAVLELSRIEAGRLELAEARVDLAQIVNAVLAMVSDQAGAKGLQLVTDARPIVVPLIGDATRLQQALLNYVANGVKFTPAGTVEVRTWADDETADGVLVHFEVQDTGIGIAPQALLRLFTAFEQADNSLTRQYGGTGLGLAITRRLAQLMGGDAGATSILGQGSTFWFTARLRKAGAELGSGPAGAGRTAEAELGRRFGGRRILLAEDEPLNQEVIVDLLATLDVQVASDGVEAVDLASCGRYDLILMDMQMPRLDGLQAARRIRALPGYEAVPIVALTANAFASDRQRCLAAGMNDFLSKPVDPAQLASTVLEWLR